MGYGGDPSASDVNAVRFEMGDTDPYAPLLTDQEVDWAILQETGVAANPNTAVITGANLLRAAARCMLSLARKFAAQADSEIGSLKLNYSKMADQYAKRAQELFAKAAGLNVPYAGGMSISEKEGFAQDSDAVQPAFTRDQFDNPWAGETGTANTDALGLPPQH